MLLLRAGTPGEFGGMVVIGRIITRGLSLAQQTDRTHDKGSNDENSAAMRLLLRTRRVHCTAQHSLLLRTTRLAFGDR